MNTIRGRNAAEFITAFAEATGRGPTADEICAGIKIDRSQLPRVVQRLERQGVIRHTQLFEPARRA